MNRVLRFLLRVSPRQLAVVALTGLLAGISSTVLLVYINSLLRSPEARANGVAGFVGLCLVLLASRSVSQFLLVRLTYGALVQLRMSVCRRIIATPLRRIEELGRPRLLAVLTEDVASVGNSVPGLALTFCHLAIILGVLVYLALLDPGLMLLLLGAAAVGLLTYALPVRYALAALQQARIYQDRLYQGLRAVLDGIKELQLHRARRAAFLDEELASALRLVREHNTRGTGTYAVAAGWGETLFLAGLGTFLLVAGPEASGETLMSFATAILYLAGPLQALLGWLPMLGRASIALERIEAVGGSLLDPEPTEVSEARPPDVIELRGVRYSYGTGREAFAAGPLDLRLRRGEVVFIVGGNGGGKTTLTKVLTGLYTPDAGTVCLDGTPVEDGDRERLRQCFSALFPDSHLFERFDGVEADDAAMNARIESLGLAHKVQSHDKAFSTVDLSQGQRRRLLLALALLEDRPFYVFDEWAADQDPGFRAHFYERVLAELRARGKGILVVSHDDRYFGVADRVLRMEDGCLREQGVSAAAGTS
ncbi:cyclic peptide export ABC transporter [Pyxidicoccus trucidator]|uniref:cyclic peptide export ABC transporter n=1 Tax=Pyxidicoccus trucidator TaxID=2709662 RepID=UPI0013DA269B|nr:cyclic peptide export ABC transporter [Pyxidicoccus trucidator]